MKKNLLIILFSLGLFTTMLHGAIFTVEAGSTGNATNYTTIQAAVDAASDDDVIVVYPTNDGPTVYTELLNIDKNITLMAATGVDSDSNVTIQSSSPASGHYAISNDGGGSAGKSLNILGFVVDVQGYGAIYARWGANGGKIQSNVFTNFPADLGNVGILISGGHTWEFPLFKEPDSWYNY